MVLVKGWDKHSPSLKGMNSAVDSLKSVDTHVKGCTDALQIWVLEHFHGLTDKIPQFLHCQVVYIYIVEVKTILSVEVLDT